MENNIERDSVTCKDRHWYDVVLGIGLIGIGIASFGCDLQIYGVGVPALISFVRLVLLGVIGVDFIGSFFFRQIELSEDEVIYRNVFGKVSRYSWEQVDVGYEPRRPRRAEHFVFKSQEKTWVFNEECQNYTEMKKFLLHKRLESLAKVLGEEQGKRWSSRN